jgi:hypothetical protein
MDDLFTVAAKRSKQREWASKEMAELCAIFHETPAETLRLNWDNYSMRTVEYVPDELFDAALTFMEVADRLAPKRGHDSVLNSVEIEIATLIKRLDAMRKAANAGESPHPGGLQWASGQ